MELQQQATMQQSTLMDLERGCARAEVLAANIQVACDKAKQEAQVARADAAWAKTEVERVTMEKKAAAKLAAKAAKDKDASVRKESELAANRVAALGGQVAAAHAEAVREHTRAEESKARLEAETEAWRIEQERLGNLR